MHRPCGRKYESFMPYTEAYKEHIIYTFNGFCKIVIRYAAINAWREQSRWRQKELSFEYFADLYKEYRIIICGQTVILTNRELVAALFQFRFHKQKIKDFHF